PALGFFIGSLAKQFRSIPRTLIKIYGNNNWNFSRRIHLCFNVTTTDKSSQGKRRGKSLPLYDCYPGNGCILVGDLRYDTSRMAYYPIECILRPRQHNPTNLLFFL